MVLNSVLVLTLIIAFYQDWKYRGITWVLFPVLAAITALLFAQQTLPVKWLLMNALFVLLVIGALFIYVGLKNRKFVNVFKTGFGIGDLLFLLAVVPLFAVENYILFFITGMFLSAVFHLLISKGNTAARIPLAGYLAVYLIVLKSIDFTTITDLFYTSILQ